MIINYKNSFSEDMCGERGTDGESISFMECNEDGFIGAYNPPPDYMQELLEDNDKGTYTTNVSMGTSRVPCVQLCTALSLEVNIKMILANLQPCFCF